MVMMMMMMMMIIVMKMGMRKKRIMMNQLQRAKWKVTVKWDPQLVHHSKNKSLNHSS